MRKVRFLVVQFMIFLCLASVSKVKSQSFSYNISIDSSSAYQNLSEPTNLNSDTKWLDTYKIPVGFSFSFNGKTSDTLTFNSNGFLVLDQKLNYAVMAFNNFYCKKDSAQTYSQLSYKLSGAVGSRILKLECKNIGQTDNPKELLSYQVWLKESGTIEVFVGTNTYEQAPTDSTLDTMQVIHIGLINRNMDTPNRGLFIKGTPSNPAPAPINDENPELAYLRTIPKKGFKYIFTPTAN